MAKELDLYRKRYIQAVRTLMAEKGIENAKNIVESINTTAATFSAIATLRQYPTVLHGIDLCRMGGISADWLFLGNGQPRAKQQATLDKILKLIQNL